MQDIVRNILMFIANYRVLHNFFYNTSNFRTNETNVYKLNVNHITKMWEYYSKYFYFIILDGDPQKKKFHAKNADFKWPTSSPELK